MYERVPLAVRWLGMTLCFAQTDQDVANALEVLESPQLYQAYLHQLGTVIVSVGPWLLRQGAAVM